MALDKKYLVCDTDRHGKERYYVRVHGKKKMRIRHKPGTAAFEAAYARAIGRIESGDFNVGPLSAIQKRASPIDDVPLPILGGHVQGEGCSTLYVIGGRHKMVKIGISVNPKKRLSALQTGHPVPLNILRLFQVRKDRARLLERAVHGLLCAERRSGEWFEATDLDAAIAVGRAASYMRIGVQEIIVRT